MKRTNLVFVLFSACQISLFGVSSYLVVAAEILTLPPAAGLRMTNLWIILFNIKSRIPKFVIARSEATWQSPVSI